MLRNDGALPTSDDLIDDEQLLAWCEEMIRCKNSRDDAESLAALLRDVITDVESAVESINQINRALVPPAEIQENLWRMGWLFYEASLALMNAVPPDWNNAKGDAVEQVEATRRLLGRYTQSYLTMSWRHWAPRGLAVLRSEAIVFSKQDTTAGFAQAWQRHREARDLYQEYSESIKNGPPRLALALDETEIQLRLAETGTSCRQAERDLGRWGETTTGFEFVDHEESEAIEKLFDVLFRGALSGDEALRLVEHISGKKGRGLVRRSNVDRMTMVTAFRNPGIMTARAYLLMMPLCRARQRDGGTPPGSFETWGDTYRGLRAGFEAGYRAIEKEVLQEDGRFFSLPRDHERSLIQLRLNLGLVVPGADLQSALDFDHCLALNPIDENAVRGLSEWLATTERTGIRGDANIIGTVVMPAYIRLVELLRTDVGATPGGYLKWRRDWAQLDRYSTVDGRDDWVEAALTKAAQPGRYG